MAKTLTILSIVMIYMALWKYLKPCKANMLPRLNLRRETAHQQPEKQQWYFHDGLIKTAPYFLKSPAGRCFATISGQS